MHAWVMAAIVGASAVGSGEKPTVAISVTDLDPASAKCGITDADVRSRAAGFLVARGIQVTDRFADTWLHISVNGLYLEPADICIANVSVQLLGRTEHDNEGDAIGGFHARNRVTQLALSQTVMTRKRNDGFQQLLMRNLEEDIETVLRRVTY